MFPLVTNPNIRTSIYHYPSDQSGSVAQEESCWFAHRAANGSSFSQCITKHATRLYSKNHIARERKHVYSVDWATGRYILNFEAETNKARVEALCSVDVPPYAGKISRMHTRLACHHGGLGASPTAYGSLCYFCATRLGRPVACTSQVGTNLPWFLPSTRNVLDCCCP